MQSALFCLVLIDFLRKRWRGEDIENSKQQQTRESVGEAWEARKPVSGRGRVRLG
jgi:membrane protein implicated in regulation of membrane protease activity